MQASGQTWAKFVEILQRFQTWAEFIEICKHLQSTGQKGKAFVLTTLNTQLFRVHGISLKHQNGTLLLRTISIQNPFIRYSFERAWYSFKKMSLSVCVCVYATSPSQGTSILMENVADKITYYSQWTWPKWVVPYRLWRFSHKFEHPKSTPYYFSVPLILSVTHMYIYNIYIYVCVYVCKW